MIPALLAFVAEVVARTWVWALLLLTPAAHCLGYIVGCVIATVSGLVLALVGLADGKDEEKT